MAKATAELFKNRIIGYDTKPADQFIANPLNYRKHPQRQRDAVNASLRELGWISTVVENVTTGNVIDGHERIWQALQHNEDVPYLKVELSEAEERLALAVFDPLTNMAETDAAILDDLLREVNTGEAALQQLLAELATDAGLYGDKTTGDTEPQIDRAEELRQKWGTCAGQLWELGAHKLICGDCTDAATVARVMGGEKAAAVVTDPPFNIGLAYDVYEDNKPQAEYLAMMFECFSIARGVAMESGHLVCTLGHNATWPVRAQIEQAGWAFRHIGVWHNPQRKAGGNPGMWPFAWEAVLDFTNGKFRKLNNSNGVGYMDVWIEPPGTDTVHPAERPQKMWGELVSLVPSPGEPIYEPFDGSGTTIIACENLGRRCRACEISPGYVGVALERYFQHTGVQPVLLESAAR